MLGELAALADVLDRASEWEPDAAAVRARMLAIFGDVAERYLQQGAALGALRMRHFGCSLCSKLILVSVRKSLSSAEGPVHAHRHTPPELPAFELLAWQSVSFRGGTVLH